MMTSIIGIDSRHFERNTTKRDGSEGSFHSVLGVAVKVKDYELFRSKYFEAMKQSFLMAGRDIDYSYYCTNDFRDIDDKEAILDYFLNRIKDDIEKVHVFYTLFSKKRISEIKVYGRYSKSKKLKLNEPTRTVEELLSSHLDQCFPAICAWRIMDYFQPNTVIYHLDSYSGHIFEAQEELDRSPHTVIVFPSGDCVNPVISVADLLVDIIDRRLEDRGLPLIFENIRTVLPEFGSNTLVYPIMNRHLPKITPVDNKPINTMEKITHPVFWVFKGDSLIDSGTMKRSKSYRNLLDYAAGHYGIVKMFNKGKDIDYFEPGDYGVYINSMGREIVETYIKLGKEFKPFEFDMMVPEDLIK